MYDSFSVSFIVITYVIYLFIYRLRRLRLFLIVVLGVAVCSNEAEMSLMTTRSDFYVIITSRASKKKSFKGHSPKFSHLHCNLLESAVMLSLAAIMGDLVCEDDVREEYESAAFACRVYME